MIPGDVSSNCSRKSKDKCNLNYNYNSKKNFAVDQKIKGDENMLNEYCISIDKSLRQCPE